MNDRLDIPANLLKSSLREPDENWWFARGEDAETLRKEAIVDSRDDDANTAWFLRTVATTRGDFARAFRLMREGSYREAWNLLEQVEIACMHLLRNPFLPPADFSVPALAEMVSRWQELYPYTVFASPEWIYKRAECNICGKDIDPWDGCGHHTGTVYAGELAYRKILDAQLLGIAMVRDPVQKYSVMLIPGIEPDYTRVRYIVERLPNPFSDWAIEKTKAYHDHALFEDVNSDDDCPCQAGRSYGACCLERPGVLLPHDQVFFSEPIPDGLPRFVFRHPSKEGEDVFGPKS